MVKLVCSGYVEISGGLVVCLENENLVFRFLGSFFYSIIWDCSFYSEVDLSVVFDFRFFGVRLEVGLGIGI